MEIIKLNLARNCLRYLIQTYKIEEIYLPYYICPSLRQAVQKENCKIHFYHIDMNFYPIEDFEKSDFIVYPNYFGICSENVLKLADRYKHLIVDNAQSFFMPNKGFASFNSLRKFFPVADGAYLYIDKKLENNFIHEKNYNYNFDNFEEFVKNELRLDKTEIKYMSLDTALFMQTVDFEKIKEQKLKNFYEYEEKFSNKNLLKINLSKNDIPYCYPLLTEEQLDIQKLSPNPILRFWSPLPKEFSEYKFYKHLIPLL